jgi:hypothetical protein
MKKLLLVVSAGLILSAFTGNVLAGGHHGGHGGGHTSVSIGVGLGGPGWSGYYGHYGRHGYNWGFYYGYPCYPYRYPVVVERPVVVEERPVVVERPVVIAQPAPVVITTPAPVVERLADGRVKGEVSTSPAVAPAAPVPANTVVWIKNDNGSQTSVELRPQGTGFIGPSNEYYATMPTEEQLKAVYGLKSNVQPAADTVTVLVNNSDGTKTSVTLTKDGSKYIGPKGEYYPSLPTEEQLKLIYGK